MKTIISIVFFSICVSSFLFSTEYNESNMDIDAFLNNNPQTKAECKSLGKSFKYIYAGSVVLSCLPIAMSPSVCFAFPMVWNEMNTIIGSLLLIAMVTPTVIVGSVLLYKGVSRFEPHYHAVQDETKFVFALRKYKSYLCIGISTAAVSGASFLTVMSGAAMHIYAYFNPSVLMMFGIIPDVIGGLGLLVCLPMMIAAFAMSAWCKGELAKFAPDIAITHDDKQGYTEGYSVSIGMRVRI